MPRACSDGSMEALGGDRRGGANGTGGQGGTTSDSGSAGAVGRATRLRRRSPANTAPPLTCKLAARVARPKRDEALAAGLLVDVVLAAAHAVRAGSTRVRRRATVPGESRRARITSGPWGKREPQPTSRSSADEDRHASRGGDEQTRPEPQPPSPRKPRVPGRGCPACAGAERSMRRTNRATRTNGRRRQPHGRARP